MPISIDLSDVMEFEVIPAGRYTAVLTDIEEMEGPSGFPYLRMQFTVKGGEHDDRMLWNNLSLAPQAMWMVKRTLVALGLDPEDLLGEFEFEPVDLIGVNVVLTVGQEEYEGEMRNRVTRINKAAEEAKPNRRRKAK